MWLQANAYDAVGGKVGSVRQAFGTPAAHDPIRPKTFVLR